MSGSVHHMLAEYGNWITCHVLQVIKGVYVSWPGCNQWVLYAIPLLGSSNSSLTAPTVAGMWILPCAISCACSTSDGAVLGIGLKNGSVVIWDDHLGEHHQLSLAAVSTILQLFSVVRLMLCK